MHILFKAPAALCGALLLSVLSACGGGGGGSTPSGSTPTPTLNAGSTDKTAPTIVTSATVGTAAVVLTATVSDNVAVTQVDFVIDGGSGKASASDSQGRTVYSVSIPVAQFTKGRHSFVAQARDAAGNTADAQAVSFDMGQGAVGNSPIQITATATTDGAGASFVVDIASVKQVKLTNLFIDGEFIGGRADDGRHYAFARVLSKGKHSLVVDVTDVDGVSAQTEVVVEI